MPRLVSHEFSDARNRERGEEVVVYESDELHTQFELVLDGPNLDEWVIHFDDVDLEDTRLTLKRHSATGREVTAASIAADLHAWGPVGEWLREVFGDALKPPA